MLSSRVNIIILSWGDSWYPELETNKRVFVSIKVSPSITFYSMIVLQYVSFSFLIYCYCTHNIANAINHRNLLLNEDILVAAIEEVEMIINRTPFIRLSYLIVTNLQRAPNEIAQFEWIRLHTALNYKYTCYYLKNCYFNIQIVLLSIYIYIDR